MSHEHIVTEIACIILQHGKEEINSSIIQQKLSAIEKCNKSTLSAEEAQSMEDER